MNNKAKIEYIFNKLPEISETVYEGLITPLAEATEKYNITSNEAVGAFLAITAYESGFFRYKAEIWGNTPAQQRYDTRVDLGNTPEKDGDGYENRGSGFIQITGAANLRDVAKALNKGENEIGELLRTDNTVAALGAAYFFSQNIPTRYINARDIKKMSGIINCGSPNCTNINGLKGREDIYYRIMAILDSYEENPPRDQPVWESKRIGGATLIATGTVLEQANSAITSLTTTASSTKAAFLVFKDFPPNLWKALGLLLVFIGITLVIKSWVDWKNGK